MSQVKRVVLGAAEDVANNHIFSFSAALGYYFVLALFPALITLAAIVAYLPIPDLFNTVVTTLARVAPPQAMPLIRPIVSDVITPSRGALLSFGVVGTLWVCSSGFATLIEAINVAYDVPETRPWWKTRWLAVKLMFVVGTLVTLATALIIVGPHFGIYLDKHLGITRGFGVIWPVLRYVVAVGFTVLAVEVVYFMAPNIKQRFTSSLAGAIVAVVGWILASEGLGWYLSKFGHLNKTYGVLGGAIALLTWLYWSGFIILVGAELNSEIIQQRRRRNPATQTASASQGAAHFVHNRRQRPAGERAR